ncbi:MAG: STAS domain-containing protein [Planctomycetaceae bacterium]|nr:STAS domain-containing protein [Planctomycetaceae bacterium]
MDSYRYFAIEQKIDAIIARAVDSYLDSAIHTNFARQELLQIIDRLEPKTLVIDLQNVKRISSSMIEALLVVQSRGMKTNIRLTMTESLRSVFQTLKLDRTTFRIFSSNEEATVNTFQSKSYFDVCGRLSPPDEEFDMTLPGP